jgi:hypothetical protein
MGKEAGRFSRNYVWWYVTNRIIDVYRKSITKKSGYLVAEN